MRKAPTAKQLQKIVDKFNAQFPVGTKLILRKDSGEVETEVKAPAEVLHGHSAVGWFVGVSGLLFDRGQSRAGIGVRITLKFTGPPPKRPPFSKRGIGGSRAIFCSWVIL
jgi:hypothetical protein